MKIITTACLVCALFAVPALAAPSAPSAPPAPGGERPLYHFEVEVSTTEPGLPAATTTFNLTLEEHRHAEVSIGDNIALAGSGGASGAPTRHNVGTRLGASFEMRGADVLLDVDTEISAITGGSGLHSISAKDQALAPVGKKTLVLAIVHDKARTVVSVTPTKL